MTGLSMGAFTGMCAMVGCALLVWILPGFFHVSGASGTLFRIVLVIQSLSIALNVPARIMGAIFADCTALTSTIAPPFCRAFSRELCFGP